MTNNNEDKNNKIRGKSTAEAVLFLCFRKKNAGKGRSPQQPRIARRGLKKPDSPTEFCLFCADVRLK